jgi:hypothetical protein
MMLVTALIMAPAGLFLSIQAVREFRRRHVVEDQEFVLEVKSYEVIPHDSPVQPPPKKKNRWLQTF